MKKCEFPLLIGLDKEEITVVKNSRYCQIRRYIKNTTIFHRGQKNKEVGTVLVGSANIENVDMWGNKTILTNVAVGEIFAETYALTGKPMMVDVIACENCEILFLDLRILEDDKFEKYNYRIQQNLLTISASKNLLLSNRIFYTAPKHIRARVLLFLSNMAIEQNKKIFNIPFNRQQMADFLNVERTALSKELAKMQADGLIEYYKNTFKVIR